MPRATPKPPETANAIGVHFEKMRLEAEKYNAPLLALFTDDDGNQVMPAVMYESLRETGILKRITAIWKRRSMGCRGAKEIEDTEVLTPLEQAAKQKTVLYAKALAGDVSASKLWHELNSDFEKEQVYNVSFHIRDYKIKDTSLRRIAEMSERHFVHDILAGIGNRLHDDKAPQELCDLLADFDEKFQAWAYEAYMPKNG